MRLSGKRILPGHGRGTPRPYKYEEDVNWKS
jgi:hypothetical protein